MNLRTVLASVLLASCSTTYGDPGSGHHVLDHQDMVEDLFCVLHYSFIGEDSRAHVLSKQVLNTAKIRGHSNTEMAQAIDAMVYWFHQGVHHDDWLRYVEYLNCAGRTD